MSFSTFEAQAVGVYVTDSELVVELGAGHNHDIHIPLEWYPRLLHATPEERADWELIDDGRGIHWEDIDEDISVAGLLARRRSSESEKSLARWLASREIVKV